MPHHLILMSHIGYSHSLSWLTVSHSYPTNSMSKGLESPGQAAGKFWWEIISISSIIPISSKSGPSDSTQLLLGLDLSMYLLLYRLDWDLPRIRDMISQKYSNNELSRSW